MFSINRTTMPSFGTTTTENASNLGPNFNYSFGSKPVSQTTTIPTPKPPVPEGVAMPPNRSPAKVLNKIRSNSLTTQVQAVKQARDCVEEFFNETVSLESAVEALFKVQQTFAASKRTGTTTSIAPTNSMQSPAHPKPKLITTKAKKHKQTKNQTNDNASLPAMFASLNNMHPTTQSKSIAPITSTKPTTPTMPTTPITPAKPIKPSKPPKTKTESKAAGPSKSTAGSKTVNLTKNKDGSSTSTPAKSTPGSRTAASAKSASGPKASKPVKSVLASREVE